MRSSIFSLLLGIAFWVFLALRANQSDVRPLIRHTLKFSLGVNVFTDDVAPSQFVDHRFLGECPLALGLQDRIRVILCLT